MIAAHDLDCRFTVIIEGLLPQVNSLVDKLGEPERSKCFSIFARDLTILDELYIESSVATQIDNFNKFGLTDCGIINVARERYLVLTDDLKLANYLQKLGIDTVNFNNIRIEGWR